MVKINKSFINSLVNDPYGVLKMLTVDDVANVIQKANQKYYNDDTPLFSDQIFDLIKEYLASIQPTHPVLKNIGASVNKENKVALPYYMGSLDKIKNDEKAILNWKGQYKGTYLVSDKLDGNSGLLVFKQGALSLYTRGDGKKGQNISHLIPFLKSKLETRAFDGGAGASEVAIRGELIISKKDFASISDKGANARNTVAGLLNSKVPDLQIAGLTSFVAYEVVHPVQTPVEQMKFLKNILKVDCVYNILLSSNDFHLERLSEELTARRISSPYEIDGIVVTHNDVHPRVNGNPEFAFAFKSILTMEKAEVTVTKVEWNMSKDGIYVPVVHFTSVALDGVIITKAHGFNGKYINDNSIGPGAIIVIMRSGAVIPYIVETLVKAASPQMPNAPFIWSKTNVEILVDITTINDSSKTMLKLKNVQYFFDTIDVRGLSNGIIAKIYEKGFTKVGQILNITKEELLTVDGFKETLANKVFLSIQDRKSQIDPYLLMDASNVLGRGVGYKKVKLICDAFPEILRKRYIPSLSELVTLKGVEKTTANLFISNLPKFFKFLDENNIDILAMSLNKSVDSTSPSTIKKVKDMIYVFSGVRDKELEDIITANGGKIGLNVSSKTSVVVVKSLSFDSSKVEKAKLLHIPIMTLEDLRYDLQL
jgi:DNA ligase (NAD+)